MSTKDDKITELESDLGIARYQIIRTIAQLRGDPERGDFDWEPEQLAAAVESTIEQLEAYLKLAQKEK